MKTGRFVKLIFVIGTLVFFINFSGRTVTAQSRGSHRMCPSRCLCIIKTVRCMHHALTHVPRAPETTRILDLRFNRIQSIHPSNFRNLRNLISILLNNNLIENISEEAFRGLSSLKYLYLYKNSIQTIHKRAFRGLTSLEQLYLHDNKIRTLSPTTFSNLPHLERLFLHNNFITTLPDRLFSGLTSLKRLRLDSNKLKCDCHLQWLSTFLRAHGGRIQASAVCYSPRSISGLSITSVPLEQMTCNVDADDLTVVTHPQNLLLAQGQSAHFFCRVEGTPRPEISWEKDGRLLRNNRRVRMNSDGSLYIQSTQLSDRGLYRCVADNGDNEVESNEAQLDFRRTRGALVFLDIPANTEATVNEQVTLSCRASGDPAPVISWYRDEQRLSVDSNYIITTGSLHIRAASVTDSGKYTCVAFNNEGKINSSAILTVTSPPHFTITPDDQSVHQGRSVTLDCHAEGTPTPEITWLHDREPLGRDQRYLVMSSGSLLIRAVNPEDEGTYRCTARSSAASIFAEADVAVIIAPHFTMRPQNQLVGQGRTVDFLCQVAGRPQPHIVWTVNGRAVPDDPRYTLLPSGTLRLLNVQLSDAGTFRCDAANSAGVQHTQVTLTVIPRTPLVFSRTPTDQIVEAGTRVRIPCQVNDGREENQAIETFWSKDGVRIVTSGERYFLTPAPSSFLEIINVGRDDSGRYECTVRNGNDVLSASMTLVVRVKNSVSEIVERLSSILPPNCLRHGCTRELIDEEGNDHQGAGTNIEDLIRTHFASRRRSKRQSGSPDIVNFAEVQEAVRAAAFEVDRGINGTLRHFNERRNNPSSGDLFNLIRFPSTSDGVDVTRAAEIFDVSLRMIECCVRQGMNLRKSNFRSNAEHHSSAADELEADNPDVTSIIGTEVVELVANLSGCSSYRAVPDCSENICFHRKYRSFDGTCNNLHHAMWGASLTPFHRLLQPIYENGFNSPIGWNPQKKYNNHTLPSARSVSVSVLESAGSRPPRQDTQFTHMVMQWGQFLDHDIDFTTMAPSVQRFSDGVACKDSCDHEAPCFPVKVDSGDSRHGRFHHQSSRRRGNHHRSPPTGCMEFTRSSAVCGSGITSVFFSAISRREQINQITSYLDASNVYSSSDKEASNLRDLSSDLGLLKTGDSLEVGQKPLLPYNVYSDLDSGTHLIRQVAPIECRRGDGESPQQRGVPCFLAGDLRANEQVSLTTMHTLWMREHNRIAGLMKQANEHWDGDTIFHETRKLVGAQMQHITYNHWLPKLLGSSMDRIGSYRGYDPNLPSSIVNVFATAAYRFGHTMINPIMYRLNESWHEVEKGNLMLHQAFFAPFRIVHEGGIDPLIRGLIAKPMKARDSSSNMNAELIERLFSMAEEVALDLGALNIQRGRDHALPFYNDWRKFCNMSRADTFDDLANEIPNLQVREKLRELYGTPDNIDPFVGMIVEDVIPGSRVGPTLACLLTEQFKRTRDGDRFWYENPGVFSPAQLTSLKQSSLARIICDNTDSIKFVPRDVFLNQPTSDFVSCDEIPSLDLSGWTDCCRDCSESSSFETLSGYVLSQSRAKRSTNEMQDHRHRRSHHHDKTRKTSRGKSDKLTQHGRNNTTPVTNQKIGDRVANQPQADTQALTDTVNRLFSVVETLESRIKELQLEVSRLKSEIPTEH